jgi:hypothetical protein
MGFKILGGEGILVRFAQSDDGGAKGMETLFAELRPNHGLIDLDAHQS